MTHEVEYWNDLQFLSEHFPRVAQAHEKGGTAEGQEFLIPDGRLLRLSAEGRVLRQDVTPRVLDGALSWALVATRVIAPFGPQPGLVLTSRDLRRSAQESGERSAEDSYSRYNPL